MNTTTTALPADVETLMRGLRLPHARAIAAEVLATARAQRWPDFGHLVRMSGTPI